jgi:hypothetical protein
MMHRVTIYFWIFIQGGLFLWCFEGHSTEY